MVKGLMSFFQYSNAPLLQYFGIEAFHNLRITFSLIMVP